jgi:hypothetical protein
MKLRCVFPCLLICLLFSLCTHAHKSPVKWGKVSKEEWSMKECAFVKNAPAVVISDFGKVSFGYGAERVFISRHKRIKILDEKGIDHGNIKFSLYTHDRFERLKAIKAHTINRAADGKEEIIPVDKSEFFEVDIDGRWTEVRFTFPKLQVGSIVEFEYTYDSNNVRFLEAWMFESELPTLTSKFTADIAAGLDYRILYQGDKLKEKYGEGSQKEWVLTNLPHVIAEPGVGNPLDYTNRLRFQLAGYYSSKQVGGTGYVTTMTSWEKLAKEVLDYQAYRSYLNRGGAAKKLLAAQGFKPSQGTFETLENLQSLVAGLYSWNGRKSSYPNHTLPALDASKNANSADINLVLVALAQELGLEAYPVLISTRSHGAVSQAYPLLTQFNHTLCAVLDGDRYYFLDATNPKRPFPYLDEEDLVANGLLLNASSPRWINLSHLARPVEQKIYSEVSLKDKALVRKYKAQLRSYGAVLLDLEHDEEADWITKDFLLKEDEYSLEKEGVKADRNKRDDLTLFFDTSQPIAEQEFISVSPFACQPFIEIPYTEDVRRLPYENVLPLSYVYYSTVKVPEAYQFESFAYESRKIELKEGMGVLKIDFNKVTDHTIQIQFLFQIKDGVIAPKDFPEFNSFIKSQKDILSSQIIFRKKN